MYDTRSPTAAAAVVAEPPTSRGRCCCPGARPLPTTRTPILSRQGPGSLGPGALAIHRCVGSRVSRPIISLVQGPDQVIKLPRHDLQSNKVVGLFRKSVASHCSANFPIVGTFSDIPRCDRVTAAFQNRQKYADNDLMVPIGGASKLAILFFHHLSLWKGIDSRRVLSHR